MERSILLLEVCHLTGLGCAVVLFYFDRQQIIGSFFHKTYHKFECDKASRVARDTE